MNLTQYAIFEICTECNLGDVHPKCPNRHPQRYGTLPTDTPVSDDQIVELVTALYRDYGFQGHIGWHYYNEPLIAAARMWRLMDRLGTEVPEASFTLWTNGTLLPEDCSQFIRFTEIHVTNYGMRDRPIRNLRALQATMPGVHYHRGHLDDRLHAQGKDRPGGGGCNRMLTEFIVDYWGNVHLCCYDWAGTGSIGNVHDDGLGGIVRDWQEARIRVAGKTMVVDALPTCRRCKMRSQHIPQFIPEIAGAAKEYIERPGG